VRVLLDFPAVPRGVARPGTIHEIRSIKIQEDNEEYSCEGGLAGCSKFKVLCLNCCQCAPEPFFALHCWDCWDLHWKLQSIDLWGL
jgi:hypothetical protein